MTLKKLIKQQSKFKNQMKIVAVIFAVIFTLIFLWFYLTYIDLKYNGVEGIAYIYNTKLETGQPGSRFNQYPPDATVKYSVVYYKYFAKGKTYKGSYQAGASVHIAKKSFIEPKILIRYSKKRPWNHVVIKSRS